MLCAHSLLYSWSIDFHLCACPANLRRRPLSSAWSLLGECICSIVNRSILSNRCHMLTRFIGPFASRDISFPSGILILSNAMHRHHQGLTASLVATTVDYLLRLPGLGSVGTAESHVNDGGCDVLWRYRVALHMSISCAGLDLPVSVCFMWASWRL